jgi:AmmeMemoRadiSam system protein B
MSNSRQPAVAGLFYPGRASQLTALVRGFFGDDRLPASDATAPPVALIVPHAGLIYSGEVAATAYQMLVPHRRLIRRVALFGPAHRVALTGMAVPSVDAFMTPLGPVKIDTQAIRDLLSADDIVTSDHAHRLEHSLEVQLPFLQNVLQDFSLIPVVVGVADTASVAAAMAQLQALDDTLLLISSDLSHFHDYSTAREIDADTASRIVARESDLNGEQACGYASINALLQLACQRDWRVELLDLRNSGDTAGSHDRVVGYGAFALRET